MKADRRAVFLRALNRLQSQPPGSDARPVTGMVGQKCLGFITTADGRVIRFVGHERGADSVGPGWYTPVAPDTFTKSLTISANSRRFEFMTPSHAVGPTDHTKVPAPPRKVHRIRDWPWCPSNPILSGNLEHQSWIPPLSARGPTQRRFPTVRFRDSMKTRQFTSMSSRELFAIDPSETADAFYDPPRAFDSRNKARSSIFACELPRFPPPEPMPAPGDYEIASALGNGRRTSLCDLFGPVDADPPLNLPGPGHYDTAGERRGKSVPPRSRYVPANLRESREVIPPKPLDPPAPGQYEPEVAPTRIPARIRDRAHGSSIHKVPGSDYETRTRYRVPGGVIGGDPHRDPLQQRAARENDHLLAFRTLHSSMVRRSANLKVLKSLNKPPV
jgi:hypothetical protein